MSVTTIKGIFLRQREYGIDWPGGRYDVESHIQEYTEKFLKMGGELGVRIECEEPFYDESDITRLVDKEKEHPSDGIVVILLRQLHGQSEKLVSDIVGIGRPTVIFTPYFWMGRVSQLYRKEGVYFISTLDFDAVKYGIKMIKAVRQLRDNKIIILSGNELTPKDIALPFLGTKVRIIPRARFVEEFKKIDETKEVVAIAEEYMKNAKKIIEPSRRDVIEAAKTYVAFKSILEAENGDAITLDCLGLVGAKLIPTTPCIGCSKLCDEGTPAGCEADLDSLLTMLILRYLFDKPSFIGDPTADTVRNTWINSHCTSATCLDGVGGLSEPFILHRYGHLNLGVSPQVLWRERQEVTLAKFQSPSEMVIGSGKVVRNIDTPPSYMCITSVEVKVDGIKDATDVANYVKGLHVLLMYENKAKELLSFCQLMGMKGILISDGTH